MDALSGSLHWVALVLQVLGLASVWMTRLTQDTRLIEGAPVGHRQPRAEQVPDEKNLGDPNDPINRENAALDRMVKGICRGC